ncbi:VOC family protein [uncultured Alsobacter sp.]|uniref:VOC family protein n=1 Tax=uncultured Alsobacter sp. TaxID=1748258 RepID=UPI0025D94A6A|nr:VOC family protein [uncultured Alsobacter sp.]
MPIQPYLSFEGRCEEAIAFYKQAVGAEVEMMMRFSDAPDQPPPGTMPPGSENKIMHAGLKIDGSAVGMTDGYCSGKAGQFQGISLTLVTRDEQKAERAFAALAEGGQVMMPLAKTFFSKSFGSLTDRFGVSWMVYVEE